MSQQKTELVINPTERIDPVFFNRVVLFQPFVTHYEPTKFAHPSIDKTLVFTHPYFKFTKPVRTSKKNGLTKPPTDYIMVYDPEFLGEGMFGAVYPISGVFKIGSNQTQLKERSKGKPRRVVKTNAHIKPDPDCPVEVFSSYKREHSIGQYVPHMGYKYPPMFNNNIGYLLMDEQPGLSLRNLIEQLKINRNFLTFTEQLKIIIELLEKSDEQISNIVAPATKDEDAAPIVHRDIKPENILIDLDTLSVKFIDYGLAKKVNQKGIVVGTALYKDPLLYNGTYIATNSHTDFSSLARVIAEFLGDTSYDEVANHEQLKQKNINNLLPGLLKGIVGITLEEQEVIYKTVKSITDQYNRLTKAQTIEVFKKLLAVRLEKEDYALMTLAQEFNLTDLKNMDKKLLLKLLSSRYALIFLHGLNKSSEYFSVILKTLGEDILLLDIELLLDLKKQGMDFSGFNVVNNPNLQAKHLKTLIELGVSINESLFNFWVDSADEVGKELNWIEVFRILYARTSQDKQLLCGIKKVSPFKAIFFDRFLNNPHASTDDKSNVRLIKRHLELVGTENKLIESIKILLNKYFDGSELQKAILSSELLNLSQEPLRLVDTTDNLLSLNSWLISLAECNNTVTDFISIPKLSFRESARDKLKERIETILSVRDGNWLDSIIKVDALEKAHDCFLTVENHRTTLLAITPLNLVDTINLGFNSYYESIPLPVDALTGVDQLEIIVDKMTKTFETITKIKETLDKMRHLGFKFPSGTPAERKIILLEQSDVLSNADHYTREIRQFHSFLVEFNSRIIRLTEVKTINECSIRDRISENITNSLSQALLQAELSQSKILSRHLNNYLVSIERLARKLNSSNAFQDFIYGLIIKIEPNMENYEHITSLIDIVFSSVWIHEEFLKEFNTFFNLINTSDKKDFCNDKMKSFQETLSSYLVNNPQNPQDKWAYIIKLTKIMKEVQVEHSKYNSYQLFKEIEFESCVVTPPTKNTANAGAIF